MFLVGMLPWSFSAARAMLRPSFAFARGDGSFNAERLLWLYIVVVIAFFSLSGSKLPAYILPALPAAAVLVAPQLQRDGLPVADVGIAVLFGCVVVLLAVLLPAHLPSGVPLEMALNYRPWLFAAGCALLATGLLAYLQRRHIAAAITAIALGTILATQLLLCGFQALAPLRSSKQVAEVIRQQPLRADTPIYMVDEYTPSLPFYLQRPATIVVARSELGPGIDAEPQKWLETPEKFAKRWQNDTFAVAVIANEDFDTYDRSDIPMRIVYRGSRDTVVIPLR